MATDARTAAAAAGYLQLKVQEEEKNRKLHYMKCLVKLSNYITGHCLLIYIYCQF